MGDPASPITKSNVVWLPVLFLMIGMSLLTPAFLKWIVAAAHPVLSACFGAVDRLSGMNLQKNLSRNAVAVAAVFFGINLICKFGKHHPQLSQIILHVVRFGGP